MCESHSLQDFVIIIKKHETNPEMQRQNICIRARANELPGNYEHNVTPIRIITSTPSTFQEKDKSSEKKAMEKKKTKIFYMT